MPTPTTTAPRPSVQPVEGWPFPALEADYRDGADVWRAVSTEFAAYCLEVLPPIYAAGGFLVSEPLTHRPDGQPVCLGVTTIGGRSFARYCTPREWPTELARLHTALREAK